MTCKCGGVIRWNQDLTAMECTWCDNPRKDDQHNQRLATAGESYDPYAPTPRRERIPQWPLVPVGAYKL